MSTPIEYSRVVQELDTVIDDRDDALRQVAAARTQMATVRAALQALCDESEQVRRSSRILPGVEPMVYVSDIRALLADDGAAGLREHDEHVRQPLRDALTRALSELGGNHSGHWDSTGGRGSGCPVCIREREIRSELMAVLDATRPTAVDTAGEVGDADS